MRTLLRTDRHRCRQRAVRSRRVVGTMLASGAFALGCASSAAQPATVAAPPSRDAGLVCKGLLDHFVGLPAEMSNVNGAREGAAPLAGRWWIRSCSTRPNGKAVELDLRGPGWYWVDVNGSDIALHQQVSFQLSTSMAATFRAAYSDGVISVWLEPSREPIVQLEASTDLDVHGTSAWGTLLQRLPFVPIRSMTARHLSESAASALSQRLRHGATVTYDILAGQSDIALGQLGSGKVPHRPFDDGAPWLTNDRLLLPAMAAQVLGPIEPAERRALDVMVEHGPGVTYRAICTRDMPRNLEAVMNGKPEDIPARDLLASGVLKGQGTHGAELHVTECPFYLVVSSSQPATTLAALRLRD